MASPNLDLIDRALEMAAETQMIGLFDALVRTENVNAGIGPFESGLRKVIEAYFAADEVIIALKAETEVIEPLPVQKE